MELNIDLKRRRGASIASTDTASSQHLEQRAMDHVHHKKGISGVGWIIGPGGGSRHGTGRDATGAIGTAPVRKVKRKIVNKPKTVRRRMYLSQRMTLALVQPW